MAANINDKLIEAENGGNPQPTNVSSARSIGGTSLSCVALTNWPTATAVHLITYKKKTDGTMDRTTLCLWKGIVSGTTIGTLTLKGGTDTGNSVGDFVEMAPTSSQWQDLYDGLTAEHNNDGTHGNVTADSVSINSGGTFTGTGVIGTAALADSAVTAAKMADPGWQLLGRTSLSSSINAGLNLSVSVGTFKYYHILAVAVRSSTPTGSIFPGIHINGDTGSNYWNIGYTIDNNSTIVAQNSPITNIGESDTFESGTYIMSVFVTKLSSLYPAFTNTCGGPQYSKQTSGWWKNTAAITSFSLLAPSTGWGAGTEIVVLGHN